MKRTKYILLPFVILVLFVLSSCKKDELKIYKLEISSETVVKSRTSATITVNYTYPTNLKSVDAYLSLTSDMTVVDKYTATVNNKILTIVFDNLQVNTTYYYMYEYSNGIDIIQTDVKSFTTNDYSLPIVTIDGITNITDNSAICGGNVTDDGGLTITDRGVCWSTSQNPTINDPHTSEEAGSGAFTCALSGLNANTIYYVRAYATNSLGTQYGEQKFVKTMFQGVINGLFSVSATKQVYFAKGNLQYQASTNIWRFAENQWDYIGDDNVNISSTYSGWIDLFGWGTSGYNSSCPYNSWSRETDTYGPAYGNIEGTNYDWGVYCKIENGGNTTNQWRTMTNSEFYYLFQYRQNANNLYSKATVAGVHGMVLLPDAWVLPQGNSFSPQQADWTSNIYTTTQWQVMEANGAIFFPASGMRMYKYMSNGVEVGGEIRHLEEEGWYWVTTRYESCPYFFDFKSNYSSPVYGNITTVDFGGSVRLIRDA